MQKVGGLDAMVQRLNFGTSLIQEIMCISGDGVQLTKTWYLACTKVAFWCMSDSNV